MSGAAAFGKTLGIDQGRHEMAFKNCWLNIYGYKDSQEVHDHKNSIISGGYYVRTTRGAAGLTVYSLIMGTMYVPPQIENNVYNIEFDEIFVEEGLIVLFRRNLKRSVEPNPIHKDRISISFNFNMHRRF